MLGKKTVCGILDEQDNSFDILRIVVALSIISTHLLAHIPPQNMVLRECMGYFNSYFYGVVAFFAISGFLMPRSIERSHSFGSFLKKRLLRLYPGIWGAFFISAAVIIMLYRPFLNWKRITVWLGTQLTFFQVYTPEWLRGYGNGTPNGALWTIITELQLYVVAWVFYKQLKKLTPKQWIAVILAATVANLICWYIKDLVPHIVYRVIFISFVPHLYIFLLGMCLYFHKDTLLAWLVKHWVMVLSVYTIWMTVFYFFIPSVGFYAPIHIGLTLPVMIISVAFGLGKHRLKYEISYGMYLYHVIIINALIQLGITDGLLAMVIVVTLSVIMGFAENILIDRNVSKLIKMYSR
ncbi:MAG: acyltransferase [Clostridiales bacterium]|nr:acyltransferase [Clostridiales bacterium]MBE5810084.1 acyltransferase [Clostridiales bacterium]